MEEGEIGKREKYGLFSAIRPKLPLAAAAAAAVGQSPGLVVFITAVAYHFCLALPVVFTHLGDHFLAESCIKWNFEDKF